ncbi:MAG: DUF4037 domain-containing protein [Spirochaetales bacterium]|nr:DUF4037 domain-containing protein [Spirochaetales bacterium]
MKRKVERIASEIAARLLSWENVDTVCLAPFSENDPNDPYFFISLDVYFREKLPDIPERETLFRDAGGLESSVFSMKDRFYIEDLPVRLEYKDMDKIDKVLDNPIDNLANFRQSGTYMFYRIQTGITLEARSSWLSSAQEKLSTIPDTFWKLLAYSWQATLEHYLNDIQAAVLHNDTLFYMLSLSGFIKSLCSMLFVINRTFESSGRFLHDHVLHLSVLPENFSGLFEGLISLDPDFTPARKEEISEHIVRSLLPMLL